MHWWFSSSYKVVGKIGASISQSPQAILPPWGVDSPVGYGPRASSRIGHEGHDAGAVPLPMIALSRVWEITLPRNILMLFLHRKGGLILTSVWFGNYSANIFPILPFLAIILFFPQFLESCLLGCKFVLWSIWQAAYLK